MGLDTTGFKNNPLVSGNKTNFEKVKEFHRTFNLVADPTTPEKLSEANRELRFNLHHEEFVEVSTELGFVKNDGDRFLKIPVKINIQNLAKELADLLYVVYGTAATAGIPIDKVFDQVHASNMSKLTADGQVLRREDGKILKSDQYKPVDLSWLNSL